MQNTSHVFLVVLIFVGTFTASTRITRGGNVDVPPSSDTPPRSDVIHNEDAVKYSDTDPSTITHDHNYPNPFNTSTMISYVLPEASHAFLRVFDIYSREVAILVDAEEQAGTYRVVFDGEDMPSGTYIYKLETEGITSMRMMTLLK